MNVSKPGIDLIKEFEGVRLSAYKDPVGVWTIGYGSTTDVKPGMMITEAEAEALLSKDLRRFEAGVNRLITSPLTQPQFDALVSFSFNVGTGALERSTLRRKLNAGDYRGAADELLRWNKAGGKVLAGLTRRRAAERSLFLAEPDDVLTGAQGADPDGVVVDLPRLKAPFRDSVATRLMAAVIYNRQPEELPAGWLDDDDLTAAIRDFQRGADIVPDGDVGAVTWATLVELPQQANVCLCCGQPIGEDHDRQP